MAGLYTREDYERDLKLYDTMDAAISSQVAARQINSFDALDLYRKVETARLRARGKLVGTGLILSDRDRMYKSGRFAWVIGIEFNANGRVVIPLRQTRKKMPVVKWLRTNKLWQPITMLGLSDMLDEGITLVKARSFRREDGEEVEGAEPEIKQSEPELVKVSRDEAKRLSLEGEWVPNPKQFDKDGKPNKGEPAQLFIAKNEIIWGDGSKDEQCFHVTWPEIVG
jgi:hypothetical protein